MLKKRAHQTTGRLDDLSLAEIVQTLTLGMKTARLELHARGRRGTIWVERGDVRHACSGDVEGEPAFCEMVGWWSGRFVIEHDVAAPRTTIRQDGTWLVMEALRRIDENRAAPAATERRASRGATTRRLTMFAVAAVLAVGGWIAAGLLRPAPANRSPATSATYRPGPDASGPATVAEVDERIPVPAPVETPTPAGVAEAADVAGETAEPMPVRRLAPREFLNARLAPTAIETGLHWSDVVAPKPEPATSQLHVTLSHKVKSGTLDLLLDGERIYRRELQGPGFFRRSFGKAREIEQRLPVVPGRHTLVARLGNDGGPARESVTRLRLRPGETLALRVEIGRGARRLAVRVVEPAVTARADTLEFGEEP
jgi:hypothetical protein